MSQSRFYEARLSCSLTASAPEVEGHAPSSNTSYFQRTGSEVAEKAIRYGVTFAKEQGAKITAIIVSRPFHRMTLEPEMLTVTPARYGPIPRVIKVPASPFCRWAVMCVTAEWWHASLYSQGRRKYHRGSNAEACDQNCGRHVNFGRCNRYCNEPRQPDVLIEDWITWPSAPQRCGRRPVTSAAPSPRSFACKRDGFEAGGRDYRGGSATQTAP